jgi:hypothetical protein
VSIQDFSTRVSLDNKEHLKTKRKHELNPSPQLCKDSSKLNKALEFARNIPPPKYLYKYEDDIVEETERTRLYDRVLTERITTQKIKMIYNH